MAHVSQLCVDDGPTDNPISVSVDVLEKSYLNANPILSDVSFSVHKREFVSLLAPSGCGKTTLLRIIAGLDLEFKGEVICEGKRITGPGLDRCLVFQESRLLPWLSTAENVAFALPRTINAAERERRIEHALALVQLSDAAPLMPYQLSGGMEKRVAVARALTNLPKVLLLDEPFSALDMSNKFSLQDEIASIHAREGLTSILVTHDIEEAVYLSDRILVMSGRPARISKEILVTAARPRNRSNMEMLRLMQELTREILQTGTY